MKNLFDRNAAEELKARLDRLGAHSQRQWGKMTAAQAVAHMCGGFEMALGELRPPRALMGRLMGRFIKPLALGNEEPMRKNTPTVKGMVTENDRDLDRERLRLRGLIDRFVSGGPSGITTHPHAFFGPMTPEEWAILMYKHVDHHLRQFGA